MNYASEVLKEVSNKAAILEVSHSSQFGTWINHEAGGWYYTLTPASPLIEDTGSSEYWFYTNMSNQTVVVNALTVDSTSYTEVTSLASYRSTNQSFYWDNINQRCYVHFDDNNPYYVFSSILLGIKQGYSNKAFYDENDTYHEAQIVSLPNLSMQKDPLFFGLFAYDGGSVTLDNKESGFDLFDIFGETVTGKFGFMDLDVSEWITVFKMYAETPWFTHYQAGFTIRDKRKILSLKIPDNVFDDTTYSDISDDDKNKTIQADWGPVRDVPCVITNSQEVAPANYEVKLCDIANHNIKSGQTPVVYVDGVSKTVSNFDETTGTCTIATGDYDPDANQEVTADFIGLVDGSDVEIKNALDVIKDILTTYGGASYTADQFNTTEWEAERENVPNIALHISEKITISEAIKMCCVGIGDFIIQNDGKYTFRTYDTSRATSLSLANDELLAASKNDQYPSMRVAYPQEEYLTDCTILYNRKWNSGEFQQVDNTTYQSDVYDEIGVYNNRSFETLIVAEADAITSAENIMLRSKDIPPVITCRTMSRAMELEIMQFIRLSTDAPNRVWFGDIIAEVLGFTKNLLTGVVELKTRYVKQATVLSTTTAILVDGVDTVVVDGLGITVIAYV